MKKGWKQWSNRREVLLDKLDDLFTKKVINLQRQLYRSIIEHFESDLIIEGKVIRSVTRNYTSVSNLGLVQQTFRSNETNSLLKWMARKYVQITSLNTGYYKSIIGLDEAVRRKVEGQMMASRGLRRIDNRIIIKNGGWLHSLGNFQDPYSLVQEAALNAVSRGVPLQDFKKTIRTAVLEPKMRSLKHHFLTHAVDSFSKYDRNISVNYAERLEMRAFIYQGGVIDTTRQFCKERNNKVITVEESEKWRNMTWDGKGRGDYEPLRDMGDVRCRHKADFIPDSIAVVLRPDLKDMWEL